jgi:hypothetical protein
MNCPRCRGETREIAIPLDRTVNLRSPETVDITARYAAALLSQIGICTHLILVSWDARQRVVSGWVCTVNPPRCEHGDLVMLPEGLSGPARCTEGHNVLLAVPAADDISNFVPPNGVEVVCPQDKTRAVLTIAAGTTGSIVYWTCADAHKPRVRFGPRGAEVTQEQD